MTSNFIHSFFGELDLQSANDVRWEKLLTVNGQQVDVQLWIESSDYKDIDRLCSLAVACQQLNNLDLAARANLISHLHTEPDFLNYHVEECTDSHTMMQLSKKYDGAIKPEGFVNAMTLKSISLWPTDTEAPIHFDYMLDSEASDQILMQTFTIDRQLHSIAWES